MQILVLTSHCHARRGLCKWMYTSFVVVLWSSVRSFVVIQLRSEYLFWSQGVAVTQTFWDLISTTINSFLQLFFDSLIIYHLCNATDYYWYYYHHLEGAEPLPFIGTTQGACATIPRQASESATSHCEGTFSMIKPSIHISSQGLGRPGEQVFRHIPKCAHVYTHDTPTQI